MVYGHPTINWIPLFSLDLIGTSIYSFPMNMDWWPSRIFLWIKYPTFEDETNMFQHVSTCFNHHFYNQQCYCLISLIAWGELEMVTNFTWQHHSVAPIIARSAAGMGLFTWQAAILVVHESSWVSPAKKKTILSRGKTTVEIMGPMSGQIPRDFPW